METPRKAVEQNLAELAFASVSEKSPSLMDYYLGFDLVEKNDAGTKAAGIMGFQIGKELIYVPILFLNGKVKGTDVMYLKGSDTFAVNDETKINSIIAKAVDGGAESEEEEKSVSDTGEVSKAMGLFSSPPDSAKTASWENTRFNDFDDLVQDKGPWNMSLPDFLQRAGKDFFQKAASILAIPEVWENVTKYYDPQDLMAYKIEKVAEAPKINTNMVQGPYVVKIDKALDIEKQAGIKLFTDEDKREMFAKGYIIKNAAEGDKASKVKIIGREGDRQFIETVNTTGVYSIIDHEGKARECAIMFANNPPFGNAPHCNTKGTSSEVYIIDKSGKASNVQNGASIYKADTGRTTDKEISDFVSADKISSGKSIEGNNLFCSPDGSEIFSVYIYNTIRNGNKMTYDTGGGLIYIPVDRKLVGKSAKVKSANGVVYVPSDYLVIPIGHDRTGPKEESQEGSSIIPGNISSIPKLLEKHGAEKIHIERFGHSGDVKVSVSGKTASLRERCDVVFRLVKEASLSIESAEKIATEIFDNKQYKLDAQFIRAKIAEPSLPDPNTQAGTTPSGVQMEAPASATEEMVAREGVPKQNPNDPSQGTWSRPSDEDMDLIERAADSESREVFDPAMIGTIVRTTRAMNMVEDFLPEFTDNMDRMIRLLLLFYWHNAEFADSYGIDQMADFEDLLLTTIKSTSKTIFFLEQKMNKNEGKTDIF